LGHKIGFPTANLTKVETIIPTEGVYNCRGYFRNKVYKAAVSIGSNYTFNATHPTIEAYLLDAPSNINLYGKYLTLEFNEYLRPMRKFANAKELSTQISEDVKQVLES
jgi:riboflavin kinase/FMN adenylyltransferase